jgi:gamma-glutamylcysteine synthetase
MHHVGQVHIRDGREHALIYGEKKVGDLGTSNGRSAKKALEANVVEISNELAARVRERQRVTPKEPLQTFSTKVRIGIEFRANPLVLGMPC